MGDLSQLQDVGIGFAGLGALSAAFSGFGQYQSGQEQRGAYDYNADMTLQATDQKMQTTEAQYAQLIGKQAAAYASSGVDIASGSPLLIMAHAAAQSGLQQESEFQSGTEEAALQRYYGKVAAFRGTVGGISSFISGLSGAGMQIASLLK